MLHRGWMSTILVQHLGGACCEKAGSGPYSPGGQYSTSQRRVKPTTRRREARQVEEEKGGGSDGGRRGAQGRSCDHSQACAWQ
jgi:hypothetical protein